MNPSDGRNRYATGTWLFLRALAVIHFIAFGSLWLQLEGLIGPQGVLPAGGYLSAVREHLGGTAWAQLPTLFWWLGTDTALHAVCALGLLSAGLLFAGIAPGACLAVLWLGYLSLCGVGQVFFNFQWDALLLETTFLALFVTPWAWLPWWRRTEPPRVARWLLVWLLFRLMFLSGAVKLASGDATWATLTALAHHYETQPLPTPLAWHAHHLPVWFHRLSCALMFGIELLLPVFFWSPWRILRHVAAFATIGLMLLIAVTGNYTFFNLLTVALCLPLIDDACWQRVKLSLPAASTDFAPRHLTRWALWPAAAAIVLFTAIQAIPSVKRDWQPPAAFWKVAEVVHPFRSLNNYGLFMVMTTTRPEIVIEGSMDRRYWQSYEFRHKPGNLSRGLTWVAPHQPRLDWQMWFAALGRLEHNPWMSALCEDLLKNTPEVTALLAHNPFPEAPPRYLRAVRYEYRFTTRAERLATGRTWERTPLDYYLAPVALP